MPCAEMGVGRFVSVREAAEVDRWYLDTFDAFFLQQTADMIRDNWSQFVFLKGIRTRYKQVRYGLWHRRTALMIGAGK